jgi:hypothetical protein
MNVLEPAHPLADPCTCKSCTLPLRTGEFRELVLLDLDQDTNLIQLPAPYLPISISPMTVGCNTYFSPPLE